MSDWSMYELGDIVWHEFGESDDHIVPHPGSEQVVDCASQGDFHQKPRQEVVSDLTKNSKYGAKNASHGKDGTRFPALNNRKVSMLGKGSWSCTPDGAFPSSCNNDSIKGVTSIADGTKIHANCFNTSNVDSVGNEFCADDPILGNRGAAIDGSFPLGDISPTGSDLEFFANEHEGNESSDLLYYGWPDIGNFEDVDRMFRSCDSTFGQGNAGDDELSWISSPSHAIDGSEEALKSGFKSSYSESSEVKSTLEHHEPDMIFMADALINDSDEKDTPNTYKTDPQALGAVEPANLGDSSSASWLDANEENKGESTSNKQNNEINGRCEIKISPITQTKNGTGVMINFQSKQLYQQNQSEGKRKDRTSENIGGGPFYGSGTLQQYANVKLPSSVPSTPQVFPSSDVPQEKQTLRPDFSSYLHTCIPCVHPEYNLSSHQVSVTPTKSIIKSEHKSHPSVSSKASSYGSNHAQPMETSPDSLTKVPAMTSEERVGKPHCHQQVHATLTDDPRFEDLGVWAALTNQVSCQKYQHQIQDKIGTHCEVEGVSIELPAVEVDSSTVQKHSCISSTLLDERSLDESSFRQLQYVMEQLDIKTKLCIRDSLYRLARSAEQRHNFGNSNGCGRDSNDKTGVLKTDSNKYMRFMDVETDTNPIDRSIAHLLFHRPTDESARSANNVMSHESHTMIHGSVTSQPTLDEKVVCQEEIVAGADT